MAKRIYCRILLCQRAFEDLLALGGEMVDVQLAVMQELTEYLMDLLQSVVGVLEVLQVTQLLATIQLLGVRSLLQHCIPAVILAVQPLHH